MAMNSSRTGGFLAILALIALFIIPTMAEAKLGRSGGFGSRGSKTFQAPPATRTAPGAVQPMQRTAAPRNAAARAPNATRPGMFGSMSRGGFMAGLLGAGMLGLLFGYGLSGGLGGLGAILGLVAQVALLGFAAMLLFSWWQRRKAANMTPALARANDRSRYGEHDPRSDNRYNSMAAGGAAGAGTAGSAYGAQEVPTRPLKLAEEDFNTFERLLREVQDAYAKEDTAALRRLATDEMCGYFQEDIDENRKQGHEVRISGVKLLQGDLAEAWKEPGGEYATVAMRFEIADAILERTSGKVVEGSLTEAQELTEIWTFVRRSSGGPNDWQLTAVQPADDEGAEA